MTLGWATIFYKANRKVNSPDNLIHTFLYIYRWVFAVQFAAISFVPLLTIEIFDLSYQTLQEGKQINQLSFELIKKEMICLGIILLPFLFNFLYQAKKLLDSIQAVPRKWFISITRKVTFTAVIPIILGTILSSYFYKVMTTDNVLNESVFIYNECIYMRQNPNIPGYNATKAALQEVGCKKYTACFSFTDERLRKRCLVELYRKSANFNFLAHNENRNICRS